MDLKKKQKKNVFYIEDTSHLLRYSRTLGSCRDFSNWGLLLTRKCYG